MQRGGFMLSTAHRLAIRTYATAAPLRAHNFSPGPGALSTQVMLRAQKEFLNPFGTGMGAIETTNIDATGVGTHLGIPRVPVQHMMMNAESKLRKLLAIPDNYRVLYMHGGAVGQFSAVPLNLIGDNKVGVDIASCGYWSTRATAEAQKYCTVRSPVQCDGTIPPLTEWNVQKDAAYVHVCLNETVEGLEMIEDLPWTPDLPPLVADGTSTLLSRPVDVSKYGLIYASGGKNIPAGVAVIIVREDLLARGAHPMCPQVLDYGKNGGAQTVASVFESMPNTPPVFPVWMLDLTLDWIAEMGGLEWCDKKCDERAAKVYGAVDASDGFYTNTNDPKYRSRMSASWRIKDGDRALEKEFVDAAEQKGLHYLFGHPVKGGIRATMYIGIEDAAVDELVKFMTEFRAAH